MFVDRALAVVMAAKSMTFPSGHEIRVIHVPSGQVVFRKTRPDMKTVGDDF
jgi:hypothetical protein